MIGNYEVSYGDSVCQKCNAENLVWYATNELFNEVNGSPNGILCPLCFSKMAEEKGILIIYKAELIKDNY